jgi:small subunit ribosomal protein S17
MPKKKNEEIEGAVSEEAVETPVEETAVEAAADEAPAVEESPAEETPVEAAPEAEAAPVEEPAAEVEAAPAEEAPAEVEAAPGEEAPVVEAKPKKAAPKKEVPKAAAKVENAEGEDKKVHKRAERIGIVASDKMTKTVTVRVDRLVKHPVYRKYVKKRKKFMAHDELGAKTGDKVRIQETRPLSARKRWRVVEILHRAEL